VTLIDDDDAIVAVKVQEHSCATQSRPITPAETALAVRAAGGRRLTK